MASDEVVEAARALVLAAWPCSQGMAKYADVHLFDKLAASLDAPRVESDYNEAVDACARLCDAEEAIALAEYRRYEKAFYFDLSGIESVRFSTARKCAAAIRALKRASPATPAPAATPPASEAPATTAAESEAERAVFDKACKFAVAYKAYADAMDAGGNRKGTEVVWADKEQHARCIDLLIAHDALLAARKGGTRA